MIKRQTTITERKIAINGKNRKNAIWIATGVIVAVTVIGTKEDV